jgi:DNA-binding MarR family transcriptional regulator
VNAIDKATSMLRERVAEIESEIRRLEQTLAVLSNSPATRRSVRKRAPRGRRRAQVLSHLEQNPGAKPAEIAKAIGTSPSHVHALVRKLRGEKLVKRSKGGYAVSAKVATGQGPRG